MTESSERRCFGLTRNLRRCGRYGPWRFFCHDHRLQPALWTFGAVPTDGVNSLSRDGTVEPNSPTNYAGETGSVDVSEQIPTASGWAIIAMTVAGLIVGTIVFTRRRASAAA